MDILLWQIYLIPAVLAGGTLAANIAVSKILPLRYNVG